VVSATCKGWPTSALRLSDADNALRVVAHLLKISQPKGTPEPDFIGHLTLNISS
jgi:hypothetical protein